MGRKGGGRERGTEGEGEVREGLGGREGGGEGGRKAEGEEGAPFKFSKKGSLMETTMINCISEERGEGKNRKHLFKQRIGGESCFAGNDNQKKSETEIWGLTGGSSARG